MGAVVCGGRVVCVGGGGSYMALILNWELPEGTETAEAPRFPIRQTETYFLRFKFRCPAHIHLTYANLNYDSLKQLLLQKTG